MGRPTGSTGVDAIEAAASAIYVAALDRDAGTPLEALARNHSGGLRAARQALGVIHPVDRNRGIEPQPVSADASSEIPAVDAGTPPAITIRAATPPAVFLLNGISSPMVDDRSNCRDGTEQSPYRMGPSRDPVNFHTARKVTLD